MNKDSTISPDWIALDWGTTNLRAFAMSADGTVLDECSSDQGMSALTPDAFEPALMDLLQGWTLPTPCNVVASGMVGSRQGWQEAPYRAVPCTAAARTLVRVDGSSDALRVWLVPGVKQSDPADVMRGEETQIAGFLALNADWDGVICLPGTHSKWVHVSAGEIVSFQTFLTGELFQAIGNHTVLRHSIDNAAWDSDAFAQTLSDVLSRPERLASLLFRIRANDLLNGANNAIARGQLSGALIGAELAASKPYWLGQNVALIGANRLTDLYAFALKQQGVDAQMCDANSVTPVGLTAAFTTL